MNDNASKFERCTRRVRLVTDALRALAVDDLQTADTAAVHELFKVMNESAGTIGSVAFCRDPSGGKPQEANAERFA